MQGLTDEEVMLEYKQGRIEAMDELLRRYKNPIYHFALRLGISVAEAEEITQEVFLRLHSNKDNYRPCGKFSCWIFSIAHNLCLDKLRKKKWQCLWPRKDDDSEELAEFPSPDPSPQEVVSSNEISYILKDCIQSLPFLQREALILREYQNLDYQEIAKILKKSLGAVKTLIHRARINLKTKLTPYIEELRGG